jgi:hypothetical protein
MSDSSKDSARGDFAAANDFRSGDALVDRGIALLRWEGFSVRQAAMTGYAMRTILLLNEKKGEAAVILMSTRGYPQVAESGERIEAPLLFRGGIYDVEPPHPVRLSAYVARGGRRGPAPAP